ncbi:membrane bound O-acyl transferase family protein [Tieghemostelium lacteum]|uniref:O-acyltransferase n=1 Tax=Tieghemostelium lacteum TaxID=361077 RepID=A0A152A0H8_TIELA|nr:membrane bound O-acyl transferase family protein [Tieghemostelium lacteum]|eukprot:KYQ99708.1 membrane bound O-acyl transferase family protein [Tieghemostelium lacteum]
MIKTTTTYKRKKDNNSNVNEKSNKIPQDEPIKIKPKLYSREYSLSKAYLDLPSTKNSVHKFIHSNRILIFTVLLLYILVDDKNHGIFKFSTHMTTLADIFVNPFQLVYDVIVINLIAEMVVVNCYLFHYKKISRNTLIVLYSVIQVWLVMYTFLFVFRRREFPIGTMLFLMMEMIITSWKTHSYFMVFNYHALLKVPVTEGFQELKIKNQSLLRYFGDYLLYMASPTLIYDQYSALRELEDQHSQTFTSRVISLLKELYVSLAIVAVLHYIHCEYIFPELFKNQPSIWSFLKILIPAEITFQLLYYLLYHCVFSLFADLTGFKDRLSFYDNYWEATNCKNILQGWSKPVHSWLYRHTLVDLKDRFKLKTSVLMFFTMVFSGIFHELIVSVITKNICVPWSTLNLVGCGICILLEGAFNLTNKKAYVLFIKCMLFVGHGLFYFAYYNFCFQDYDLPLQH